MQNLLVTTTVVRARTAHSASARDKSDGSDPLTLPAPQGPRLASTSCRGLDTGLGVTQSRPLSRPALPALPPDGTTISPSVLLSCSPICSTNVDPLTLVCSVDPELEAAYTTVRDRRIRHSEQSHVRRTRSKLSLPPRILAFLDTTVVDEPRVRLSLPSSTRLFTAHAAQRRLTQYIMYHCRRRRAFPPAVKEKHFEANRITQTNVRVLTTSPLLSYQLV